MFIYDFNRIKTVILKNENEPITESARNLSSKTLLFDVLDVYIFILSLSSVSNL